MNKIAIIGAGNVGAAIVALLLSQGHEVEQHDTPPEFERVFELKMTVRPVVPDMGWAEVFPNQNRHRYNRRAHRAARNNWK